jgi:hypothetical protein
LTLLKIKLKFQQKYIGRKLAACIKYMAWRFVDEDTGEVVSIERNNPW